MTQSTSTEGILDREEARIDELDRDPAQNPYHYKHLDGPWNSEPDHVNFEHAGLPCMLHRNRMGAWCGYVAVPPGHIYHGKNYSDRVKIPPAWLERPMDLDKACVISVFLESIGEAAADGCASMSCVLQVHGGVTYTDACQGELCHVPKPGEPDNVWWIGFDCAHSGDQVPGLLAIEKRHGWDAPDHPLALRTYRSHDVYRDLDYVTEETQRLAEQLRELQP